jgi:hypothetical protein
MKEMEAEVARLIDLARKAHSALGDFVGEHYDDEDASWPRDIHAINDCLMQMLHPKPTTAAPKGDEKP